MESVVWLVVVGTSIWVAFDASSLGVRRGILGGGLADMGVVGWFFCCLLLWIVAFPVYLATRPKYRSMRVFVPDAKYGHSGAAPQSRFGGADITPYGSGADRFAPYVVTSSPPDPSRSGPDADARTDRVIRLVELRDSGALSQGEFDRMKRDLIGEN